jgi:large subunit ribosomal protein L9
LAEAISNLTVTIYKKVGEDGRIFGQVTSGEIKDVLFKEKIEIDRKAIELPEQGIKSLGEYEVTVRVHPEIKTRLKVQVSPEGTE